MSQTRIYRVTHTATGTTRLIRAITKASARGHAARELLDVAVASQDDLVAALQAGIKVEEVAQAGDDSEPQAA